MDRNVGHTVTARADYPTLARVEAHWAGCATVPQAVHEIGRLLDELDRLRLVVAAVGMN
jgi:hypothetical protein